MIWMTIGFDARKNLADQDLSLLENILCQHCESVASVDDEVWTSHISAIDGNEEFRGPVQNLWSNCEELIEKMQAEKCANEYTLTHFSVAIEDNIIWEDSWKDVMAFHFESQLKDRHDWKCLGYDVCDRFLLSLLCNYFHRSNPSRQLLSGRFCSHVNRDHLFKEPKRAFEFREQTSPYAIDHCPYFIFKVESLLSS